MNRHVNIAEEREQTLMIGGKLTKQRPTRHDNSPRRKQRRIIVDCTCRTRSADRLYVSKHILNDSNLNAGTLQHLNLEERKKAIRCLKKSSLWKSTSVRTTRELTRDRPIVAHALPPRSINFAV